MPNSSGPDPDAESVEADADAAVEPSAGPTESNRAADPATEVISPSAPQHQPPTPSLRPGERLYTAPGFDAKETAILNAANEPATEAFEPGRPPVAARTATPQLIPPRLGAKLRPAGQRSWGWVLALILIILALAAIAVLGTVLLTRHDRGTTASQEDQVRAT